METKYADPTDMFLELVVGFNFDPSLTGFSLPATESTVYNFMTNYFSKNLNKFDKIFRRSNMLTELDALDPAILSSRCDVKVQLRLSLQLVLNVYLSYSSQWHSKVQMT